jgi:hypothetical protein
MHQPGDEIIEKDLRIILSLPEFMERFLIVQRDIEDDRASM